MDTSEQEEAQLHFFNFTCSQFKNQYEGMLRAKLHVLLKGSVVDVISAKHPDYQKKLEEQEQNCVQELFKSLEPFRTDMEKLFSECFHVPENMPLLEFLGEGTYSTEEVELLKSKFDSTLKAYLSDQVMIKALTSEMEMHEKLSNVTEEEKLILQKAVNLDAEPITIQDVKTVVSNICDNR